MKSITVVSRALTGAQLTIDPNGYLSPICLGTLGCTTTSGGVLTRDVPPGTYVLSTVQSYHADSSDPSLGSLTVRADNQVEFVGSVLDHFEEITGNTLRARVARVEMRSQSQDRIAFSGFDLHSEPAWHQDLLVNRRYALVSGTSQDRLEPTNWFSTAAISAHDVVVRSGGVAFVGGPSAGTGRHFTSEGLMLTARTVPVRVRQNGYTGLLTVGGSATPSAPDDQSWVAHQIIERRYTMGAGQSWDLTENEWLFSPSAPTVLRVRADGIDLGLPVEQFTTKQGVNGEFDLDAKVAIMTVTSSDDYVGSFCVQGFTCGLGPSRKIDISVIPGRRYVVTPLPAIQIRVEFDGTCSRTRTIATSGGTLDVLCRMPGSTGLRGSQFTLDPSGYRGGICLGSLGCTSASADQLGPIDVAPGIYPLTTAHSYEAEGNVTGLGTLRVDAQGTIFVDPPAANSTPHFTPDEGANALRANTIAVTVVSGGERIAFAGQELHSEPSWPATLITGRRYALLSGDSQDLAVPTNWFGAPGAAAYDVIVNADRVTFSATGEGTARHFLANNLTLTARTLPTTVRQLGYTAPITLGNTTGNVQEWAVSPMIGRRYVMGGGHTWDLNVDDWIFSPSAPSALHVTETGVRPVGDLARHFSGRSIGGQHYLDAITTTMVVRSDRTFVGTFCVQGFLCGMGPNQRISIPVIPARRYFVTPGPNSAIPVEANGTCPATSVTTPAGPLHVTCAPPTDCADRPNGSPCSDANACTTSDTCQSGVCQAGPQLSCDDGNSCTADSCDPVAGCVITTATTEGLACSDGDMCTSNEVCRAGACEGTAAGGVSCGVTPRVSCVIPAGDGSGRFTAVFGYASTAAQNLPAPTGPENQLTPSSLNGAQPPWLETGDHPAAFFVTTDTDVTWTLGSTPVTATSSSPQCQQATCADGPGVSIGGVCHTLTPDPGVALANTVVPTGTDVGATGGSFSVSPAGSASYGVRLWVPAGRSGIQPSLGLNYSSGADDGVVGVGWSLSGGTSQVPSLSARHASRSYDAGDRMDRERRAVS